MAEAVKRRDEDASGWTRGRPDRGAPAAQPFLDEESLLPPRATADGTSRRILVSALVLFAELGYHGVSVREIARGAGVRASSMYEYRASKQELLRELMLIGHHEHQHRLQDALAEAGEDPAERMRAIVRAHVTFHASYPLLGRTCNRDFDVLDPASLESVVRVRRASEHLIYDAVQAGIEAGRFQVPDSWLASAAIGGMGIRVSEWFGPNAGYDVDKVAGVYADYALRLLGCAEAPVQT